MKVNSTVIIWVIFFLVVLTGLALIAHYYIEPREIVVNESQAKIIGLKIAENEAVSKRTRLVDWREGERFSSLGIAHFIWYPENENSEGLSFNGLLTHLSQSRTLPDWLSNIEFPPWNSKENYLSAKHDVFKNQLSYFLQDNVSEQTSYLIDHLESKLPTMLKEIKSPFARMHAYENFYHIVMQENGVYTLIDYFVFMGDGTSSNKRYNNQGWGLLHILENMKGNSDNLIQEFVTSADLLLSRRVANAPTDETQWLPSWRRRLRTYSEN